MIAVNIAAYNHCFYHAFSSSHLPEHMLYSFIAEVTYK